MSQITTYVRFSLTDALASVLVSVLLTACSGELESPPASTVTVPVHLSSSLASRLLNASPAMVKADAELTALATELAEPVIAENCSTCHGANLKGKVGVPNLTDSDWLWGVASDYTATGAVMQIRRTLLHGIRNIDCPPEQQQYGACSNTRFSQMPGYVKMGALNEDQVADMTEYVLSLSGTDTDADAVSRAAGSWLVCAECHGEYGEGKADFGGPNLSDDIWLYGSDREQIYDVIANGREGVCPVWGDRLDALTIQALSYYIYENSEHY